MGIEQRRSDRTICTWCERGSLIADGCLLVESSCVALCGMLWLARDRLWQLPCRWQETSSSLRPEPKLDWGLP